MKYLSNNSEDKHKYIVSIIDGGETFSIKFADGTVYDGYEKNEENLKVVSDAMEVQAQEGCELEGYYKGRIGLNAAATVATTTASAWIVNSLGTELANTVTSITPEAISVATGVTIGIGAILGAKNIIANAEKLSEIKKFTLRNSMKEDLDKIEEYPHAFTGVRAKVKELVENFDNPFGAIHSEEYTTKDLVKISQNIEREKVYQLTPAKKKQI